MTVIESKIIKQQLSQKTAIKQLLMQIKVFLILTEEIDFREKLLSKTDYSRFSQFYDNFQSICVLPKVPLYGGKRSKIIHLNDM